MPSSHSSIISCGKVQHKLGHHRNVLSYEATFEILFYCSWISQQDVVQFCMHNVDHRASYAYAAWSIPRSVGQCFLYLLRIGISRH